MSIFEYKVDTTISDTHDEFQDWLNDQGEHDPYNSNNYLYI